ncbi:MAG: CCA tRNA nucleotidyltransferase [Planctomycetota bacterium]|nr:CCA tRNA nucleotidyltransferase [Planctomycetota bacterium]
MAHAGTTADELRTFAIGVVRKLAAAGFRAVFAGGCVRDMLLGVQPQDYDVATSATPEQTMALFPRTVAVGVAFGVVRVLSEGEQPLAVEVATFRGETTYSDGRHPDKVCFTDEVEDVKRRDFTVNGLLFDPLKNDVLDYVGGRRDLERKRLRAIGDPRQRFKEDHLRMLRAVRFASTLGFEIDVTTLRAIKTSAPRITAISAERIRDELSLMLTGPDPRRAFELLKKTRLLKHVLPEADAMEGVPQPPEFHPEGDVWVHTLLMLGHLEDASVTLALGVLLHDVGKPATFEQADRIRFNEHERVGAEMAEKIMARLKYSSEEAERVSDLVRQHMIFKDAHRMRPATLKRFLRQPHFDEHLALHRLDCLASHGSLEAYDFCVAALQKQSTETLRPQPLITGRDLIALGLEPGPRFKAILAEVEDRQLEGTLTDKESALAHVRKMLATPDQG